MMYLLIKTVSVQVTDTDWEKLDSDEVAGLHEDVALMLNTALEDIAKVITHDSSLRTKHHLSDPIKVVVRDGSVCDECGE